MLIDMTQEAEETAKYLEELADDVRNGKVTQFALFVDANDRLTPVTFSTAGDMLSMLGLMEHGAFMIKAGWGLN